MATTLICDETARRLAQSFNSVAALASQKVFKGDVEDLAIYFARQTGISSSPFAIVDRSASTVKLAIGFKNAQPTSGTWILDGASLAYNATAAQIQTALRTSQSDASLTVTGSMDVGFTITWGSVGAEATLTGSAAGLLPESDLLIEERRTGSVSVIEQQFVKVRLSPVAFLDSFTDITAAVAATVSTTTGGTGSVNEAQKVVFDKVPRSGTWSVTLPSDTRSVTAAVVAGVFTTTANHGFTPGQEVVFTGFTGEANFTEGTTYFVKAIPSATTFTIAATATGAALTTATADAGTGTITTPAKTTAEIEATATVYEVQQALEAVSSIGFGNVSVSGIAGETYSIVFINDKGLANLPEITVQTSGLFAYLGKSGTLTLSTFQAADLLADADSVTLTLEIQLTTGGITTTVVSQDVTLTADLIDGATLTPQARTNTVQLTSPDSSVWTLSISDTGVISATKP
jgi:hypothetical protein